MKNLKIIIPVIILFLGVLWGIVYCINGFPSKTYYYNKGLALVKLGNGVDYTIGDILIKASRNLERAISKGITTKEAFDNLTYCYIHLDDDLQLEKTYTKALYFYPYAVDFYYYRGETRVDLKMYAKAIGDYAKVVKLDTSKFFVEGAYYKRGACKYLLGDTVEAQNDWKTAQEMSDIELRPYYEYVVVIK